jgi:hypothetical protein
MALRKRRILSSQITGAANAASSEEQIRLRAYMLYVEHGKKDGFALDDWLLAEAETLGSPLAVRIAIRPEDIEYSKGEYEKEAGDADSVYRVISWMLTNRWGHIKQMVDALTVLLVVWNRSFYGPRGQLSQVALESWLQRHFTAISVLRQRPIATLDAGDEPIIRELFDTLLVATEVAFGDGKGKRSAVSVAKALHILAPDFFPPWDAAIAIGYGCPYSENPREAYMRFCYSVRFKAGQLSLTLAQSDKSLLKRLDEYTFVKFTVPSLRKKRKGNTDSAALNEQDS